MDFVGNHVVQFLVVNHADEDVSNEFLACCSIVEYFASSLAKSQFYKVFPNLVRSFVGEGCAIRWFSPCSRGFSREGLDELADGHS